MTGFLVLILTKDHVGKVDSILLVIAATLLRLIQYIANIRRINRLKSLITTSTTQKGTDLIDWELV